MADHQNNDDEQQPPIWGSFHTLCDRYGIAPSTARVLIRKGAIEAVRLNNKTVRINLALLSLLAAGIGVSTAKKRKKRESSQGRSAEKPA